jgi:hypothetical protein
MTGSEIHCSQSEIVLTYFRVNVNKPHKFADKLSISYKSGDRIGPS